MTSFRRAVAALAMSSAVLLLGAAPSNDAAYFIGRWSCAGTPWTFAPMMGNATWIQDVYGKPSEPDGSAIFGYVASLKRWVYRDFHADGSYADLTSTGLHAGRWVFTGPYFLAAGGAPLQGRITYVIVGSKRYDRVFERRTASGYERAGGDTCTRR